MSDDSSRRIQEMVRFFTRVVAGVDRRLDPHDSLRSQRRIVLTLGHQPGLVDAELASELGMDRSQLSNAMKQLIANGDVMSEASAAHRSQKHRSLTSQGEARFSALNAAFRVAFEDLCAELTLADRESLLRNIPSGVRRPVDITGNEIKYRVLKLEDLDSVFKGFFALRPRDAKRSEYVAQIAEMVALYARGGEGEELGWAAEQGGILLGASLLTEGVDETGARLSIAVFQPQAHHRGIGYELYSRARSQAEARTLSHLISSARDNDHGRFLRRQGFQPSAVQPEVHESRYSLGREFLLKLPIYIP